MSGSEPVTRADFEWLLNELKQNGEQLRAELKQDIEQLRAEMQHQYDDLVERISDSETRLMKVMYSLAETGNRRMSEVETDNAALRAASVIVTQRLGSMEDRLLKLEMRVNLPPAA